MLGSKQSGPVKAVVDTYILEDGEEYEAPGVDGLLAASEKLLAVNRELADTDDRDHWMFKKVHRTPDLVRERIVRDAGKLRSSLMHRVAKSRTLKPIHPFYFDAYVEGQLIGNQLSSPLEEINPLQLVEQARRVTLMGPGGIGSSDAITLDAQSVHPSTFGFLSPVEGPECLPGCFEVSTARGWVRWDEVEDSDLFECIQGDSNAFFRASKVVRADFSGKLICAKSPGFILRLTENHRVLHHVPGELDFYTVASAKDVFGTEIVLPSASMSYGTRIQPDDWYEEDYEGQVFCATVPGSFLHVRPAAGYDSFWTGNSEKAGIDTRLSVGTKIGSDGRIYQKFEDLRTGKARYMSPEDLHGLTLGIPD